MNPVVTQLHPLFVAKITDVDLGRPIDETMQRAMWGATAAASSPNCHSARNDRISRGHDLAAAVEP
jgi:hypothetical protein